MKNKTGFTDSDEEIDLVILFKKGWGIFKRRQKMLVVFVVIGIVLGVVYYKVMPPTYKSKMIISSSAFDGPSFVLILEDLQLLLKERNYEELATTLGIDVESAEKIISMEVYSSENYAELAFGDKVTFKDKENQPDESKKKKRDEFVIEAFVSDKTGFKTLESGIVYYINNNESIKEASMLKRKSLTEMKKNIQKERIELDSFKNAIAQNINKLNVPKDFFIGDPSSMFYNMVNLYQAEIKTSEDLVASNISIIESFRSYKKQNSPKLGMSLIVFTLLSIFLFVVTVIYLEVNRETETA